MREKQGREAGHDPFFRLAPSLAGRLGFTVLGTLPGPTEPSFHLEFLAKNLVASEDGTHGSRRLFLSRET